MAQTKKEREIINEIIDISSSTLDLHESLNSISKITTIKLKTDTCNICLLEEDKETLVLKASTGLNQQAIDSVKVKIGLGITGWVAKSKKTVNLTNVQNDPRFLYFPETGEKKFKSLLSVPIIENKKCIGVLSVQNILKKTYTKKDEALLIAISAQICGIIKNAQLYNKATTRLVKLTLLHKIGQELSSTLEMPDLSNLIVKYSSEITRASASILWLKEKKGFVFKASHALRDDIEFSNCLSDNIKPLNDMVTKKVNMFFFNKNDEQNLKLKQNILKKIIFTDINALILIPIIYRDTVKGLLCVIDKIKGKKMGYTNFFKDDVTLLKTLTNYAVIAIDNAELINKHIKINKDLIETHERLLQTERLATLGRVSAEFAHEIKNPLVSIGGFARRLEKNLAPETKEKRYSKIIVKEVVRLEKMLVDILDFSSVKKPDFRLYNINEIITDVANLFEDEFLKKNIFLKIDLLEKPAILNISKDQITQVFINLIINSIESMENGGTLSIKSGKSRRFGGKGIVIKIKDTGGGVPIGELHNIFNPFFTTKKQGTGLGLTLIRKIIDSHGGVMDLKNRPGEGLEFIINLPNRS